MSALRLLTTLMRLTVPLMLLMPVSAFAQSAEDCTATPSGPADAQVKCAIRHANFLYRSLCQTAPYCSSQDKQMLSAYAAAFRIFSSSHTVLEKAVDAYWSGFLQERAHLFTGATSSYLTCMSLAVKEHDIASGRSCATRLAVVSCALDDSSSYCKDQKKYTLSVSSGGGNVASMPELEEGRSVNGILVPDAKNVAILQEVLTDPEKKTIQALIHGDNVKIIARQFVVPAVAP